MNKNRNYGIELLRIVLMFMICMLHTLGHGGVLEASKNVPLNHSLFWMIEIFCFCAVDSFAIISGYVANDKPRKYNRLVDIWMQVFFYSFIITIILTLLGVNDKFEIKDVIKCALPITFNKYWYMTSYFALFFAIPVLNNFIFKLDEKTAKKMFIVIILLYSVIGIVNDSFVTDDGYSPIWLMVLYCIGTLAKKIKLFEKINSKLLIIIWLFSLLTTWFMYIYIGNGKLVNYISPTILLNAIIMVVLFSRLNFKGTVISKLSTLTLGIYLFHLNEIIWDNILNDAFIYVASMNVIVAILYILLFAFLIFLSGLIVEWFRQVISKKLKISVLSEKIVEFLNLILEKMFFFLQ